MRRGLKSYVVPMPAMGPEVKGRAGRQGAMGGEGGSQIGGVVW